MIYSNEREVGVAGFVEYICLVASAKAMKITKHLEDAREQELENKSSNLFYCPTFFDYFQNHLIPLLPFWSGLMNKVHQHSGDSPWRFSNANVENYFKQVKHRLL
jgi:hypothetical protein